MMTIKTMTATFGKLERAKLTCAEGLNLIHAPNEGGKSTWAAFYKAMLFGIDTRDRDKKGHLADKNRYQPWSGAPMEGEIVLEWQGRDITIRRGPRGSTPLGAFSAVYTATGEPVPGLTADNCGRMLTGVGREVFERSAFIGGDTMTVTAAPELEKRIAALLSAGQEDVSFSQVQSRLKDWLNRRKVNRTVGLIPKLEEELAAVSAMAQRCTAHNTHILDTEKACDELRRQKQELEGEMDIHRRLAQKALNARFAQAEEEYHAALAQQEKLEGEMAKFGALPPKEELKKKQFELQYLKVLDEEIKSAQTALEQADEAYIQAQIAAQNDHFPGMSAEEAREGVTAERIQHQTLLNRAARSRKWVLPLILLAVLSVAAGLGADFYLSGQIGLFTPVGAGVGLVFLLIALALNARSKKTLKLAEALPGKFGAATMEELSALLAEYETVCAHAQTCAENAKTLRGALNDLKARKENSRTDIFDFVHQFAPEVKELFGCSAALSRALNLEHELTAAAERTRQRRLRRDDLEAQGGQSFQTLELLHTPERSEEHTRTELSRITARLADAEQALSHALGRRQEMGDTAALFARQEELETQLARRNREYEAISMAMTALSEANDALQQRFSPQLNALTGEYFARLTGEKYEKVTLDREMAGQTARAGDVLPRSALFLSRGATDQLYLAVRLAVCRLCLDSRPPIMLDDALTAFDDGRLKLALELLQELAQQQQIILFTCQKREGEVLEELT